MRTLIVVVVGACILLGAAGDVQAAGFSKVGFKGGLNIARLNDDGIIRQGLNDETGLEWDQKFRLAFAFGGFAEFAVNEKFTVRPELLYSMKGEKYDTQDAEVAVELAYLDLPVLAVYKFPVAGDVRPGLYAGPMLSLNLSADVAAEGPGGSDSEEITTAKDIDFAIVLGAEITFQDRYFIEVRAANGFINADSESEDQNILNQVLMVMVGMSFDLPAK